MRPEERVDELEEQLAAAQSEIRITLDQLAHQKDISANLVAERQRILAEMRSEIPPRGEGCCRAAVNSEGFAHDHTNWFRDLRRAEREIARLRDELSRLA